MDPQVTCPRCHTRQPLPDPDGYTCVSCGTTWLFATCRSCGKRFHMEPSTRSWRCPNCGTENPATQAAPVPPPTRPGPSAPPATTPPASPSRPSRSLPGVDRVSVGVMVAVAVVAVIAIAGLWFLLGHKGSSTAPPSTTGSPAITATQALSNLCHDIPIDQNLRVDALRRTADQVRQDAKDLHAAGNTDAARKAVAVAVAMDNMADTLNSHGDTTADTQALSSAIEAVGALCQSG
jgi:hypothetical protein